MESQIERVNGTRPASAEERRLATPLWVWARQWEFWLALALGAFLRFWRLDLTQYLDDQTRLMQLARLSVARGLIPLTGIPSSIHTLNPPLSVYLLLPFAAFTADPMPIVISIALWNTLGVALCYIFTLRYFGRRVAGVSALLFATCGAAINYSRFLWQQNYLPPLLILWALTLYLGVVDGRRRWFAGNVALLGLATLLHPTAALLAPATLVGVVLAPQFPRLRSWLIAAVALLALAVPTLLWEALSGFSDLHALRHYATGHASINVTVLYYLYQAIGGPLVGGSTTRLALTGLNAAATALFAVGWLGLTARIVGPARRLPWRANDGALAAVRAWGSALSMGLRADAAWRARLLLWLAVTVPPAFMLRHTGGLFAHYLMVLYPTAFIVSAMGVDDIARWVSGSVGARMPRFSQVVALAVDALLLALLLGRSVQWVSYPQTLTDPRTFNAYHDYGYPLSVAQGGVAALGRVQRQTGASTVEVVTATDPRYRLPEDYLFAGDRSDRLTLPSACLLAPGAGQGSWLVTSVYPNTPALALLSTLPNAERVGALDLLGGPAYPIYRLTGAAPLTSSERALGSITLDDSQGDILRLKSAGIVGQNLLLRWDIVSAQTPASGERSLNVSIATGDAPATTTACAPQRWEAGETLYTWAALPAVRGQSVSVHVTTTTSALATPRAGSLRFLSDQVVVSPPVTLRGAVTGAPRNGVQVTPEGDVVIPSLAIDPAA